MNKNKWSKEYKNNCGDNKDGHCEAMNTGCAYTVCPLLVGVSKKETSEMEFRNYKLRFYHTEKKEMFPPSSIWKLDLYHYEDSHCLIPMLFTGKKDINNKEIYQDDYLLYGDVCSDGWMLNKTKVVGMVRFFEDGARFEAQDLTMNYRGGHYRSFWDWMIDIEVIGSRFTGIHSDYLYLLDDKKIKRAVTRGLYKNEKEKTN